MKGKNKLAWLVIATFFLMAMLLAACSPEVPQTSTPATIQPSPVVAPSMSVPPAVEPSPAQTAGPEPREKSYIWKVTSDNSHLYLLGSIHIGTSDLYPLDGAIEDAFGEADYLALEVYIPDDEKQALSALISTLSVFEADNGLKQSASPELYAKLEKYFAEQNLEMSMADKVRPWYIYMVVSQQQAQELGYDAKYGIDLYFEEKARQQGKEIISLEEPGYIYDKRASFPDELMFIMLEDIMDNPATKEETEEMFRLWEDGDLEGVKRLTDEERAENPALEPYFAWVQDERNVIMADKIEGYLADEAVYFIVVGASHMAGEKGLVNILTGKGYGIEQLSDSD